MKDSYVLYNFVPKWCNNNLVENSSEIVASLYERFYLYWDPTTHMDDMTWDFLDFPSSPLIEMFKQQPLMNYFIKEYFLNEEIYTETDIENNKIMLMIFFIKINNLLRRVYLVNNQREFVELYTKIRNDVLQFLHEIVPTCKVLDKNIFPERYSYLLPKEPLEEIYVFSNLMIKLIDYSFNASLRHKYEILSIIHKNINSNWRSVDKNAIQDEIEKMLLE